MKKIIISILVLLGTFSIASAEVGIKVGVSAQIGEMETSGSETNRTHSTTQKSNNRQAMFATAGMFIEKDLKFIPVRILNRLSLGYDNIAHDLELGTVNNHRVQSFSDIAETKLDKPATDYSLQATVSGFETVYATLNVTDWLYVKAGQVNVDIDTIFKGSATSKYPTSHSLDGTMVGFGVEKKSDNGMFFRLEFNDYSIDGKKVKSLGTDSVFTATLNDVSGTTGRIAIGKAF